MIYPVVLQGYRSAVGHTDASVTLQDDRPGRTVTPGLVPFTEGQI